ncbi:MAG: carboxypeptidase-like regulatory domain-containing protein, partial [Bacteroidota bacterium]
MRNLLTVLLLLPSFIVFSQKNVTFSGVIRDAQNGETLIGASVAAVGLSKGSASNEYGFYSLSLPAGSDSVTLLFSYVGYESQARTVYPAGEIKLDMALNQVGALMQEVVIKANVLADKVRSTEMSVTTISTRELKAVPALFGETDIIKILQLKPGFTPGSEGTTGI